MAAYRRVMTHVICRLTDKNRDQLRNPTLGNRVWAASTFFTHTHTGTLSIYYHYDNDDYYYCYYNYYDSRLMASFQDNLGKPVPER